MKGDDIFISLPKITSSYSEGRTGNLRVRLLSTEEKFGKEISLNSDSFDVVAEFSAEPLSAGTEYTNVQKHLKSINHFRRRNAIITLSEYEQGAYLIKDWHYFPEEVNFNGSVFFSGNVGYDYLPSGTSVVLTIDKIACNINGFSGSLKVSLISANKPYMAEPSYLGLEYELIGCFVADGLSKNQFYKNVAKTVDKMKSPKAASHLIMIVETVGTDGKYHVADWRNLS